MLKIVKNLLNTMNQLHVSSILGDVIGQILKEI